MAPLEAQLDDFHSVVVFSIRYNIPYVNKDFNKLQISRFQTCCTLPIYIRVELSLTMVLLPVENRTFGLYVPGV
jgi:hypothetical protein